MRRSVFGGIDSFWLGVVSAPASGGGDANADDDQRRNNSDDGQEDEHEPQVPGGTDRRSRMGAR